MLQDIAYILYFMLILINQLYARKSIMNKSDFLLYASGIGREIKTCTTSYYMPTVFQAFSHKYIEKLNSLISL